MDKNIIVLWDHKESSLLGKALLNRDCRTLKTKGVMKQIILAFGM